MMLWYLKVLYYYLYPPGQVLDNCIEAEKIVNRYEALASDLLDWIEKTIAVISNQKFANSLTGVQQQLQAFTTYCTIEKPIKYVSLKFTHIFSLACCSVYRSCYFESLKVKLHKV